MAKVNALALLAAAGVKVEERKSKLWEISKTIIDDCLEMEGADLHLYMGKEFESFFVTIGDDKTSSQIIPFIYGSIDASVIDISEEDLTQSGKAYEFKNIDHFLEQVGAGTIQIVEVVALRDDNDLQKPIKKGDTGYRAVLA